MDNFTTTKESIKRLSFKEDVLKVFIKLRNGLDELPEEEVKMDDPMYNEYKCRTKTFHNFLLGVTTLLLEKEIEEDENIRAYIKHIKSMRFIKDPENPKAHLRTKEDIIFINEALDYMIGLLSKKND